MNRTVERVRAALRFLGDEEITPRGRRIVETVLDDEESRAASDRDKLIEALFQGYKILGFDTDGCTDGDCFYSHVWGPGDGDRMDRFCRMMVETFKEARRDHDEALRDD